MATRICASNVGSASSWAYTRNPPTVLSSGSFMRCHVTKSGDETISREESIDRMKEGQTPSTTSRRIASQRCRLPRPWKRCARRVL
eukprot:9430063-Pyramimonas_sp.AAC.1